MIPLLVRRGLLLSPLVLLSACNTVVMKPSGDIAAQEAHLIVVATMLMLLIIVPVIALIVFFAWRYRASNTKATYTPDWDHSTRLELVIWGAPLLIIIALGLVTWISTHLLDPYRPLSRLDAARPIPADTKPLIVEVVALDWKWLFIYPEQGIATVNELVAPVDVPIRFKITASTVMNSFYIPALAGQIYAMPAMQTSLNAVINKAGTYDGFSANYSGAGFSDMRFKFHARDAAGFDAWVKSVKAGGGSLERTGYLQLEKPSEREPVRRYAGVDAALYNAILNRCVEPGAVCMDQQMKHDMHANVPKDKTGDLMAQATSTEVCITPLIPVKKTTNAKPY
jgi:cytochrome o ubiquinol oxidase subunit 2